MIFIIRIEEETGRWDYTPPGYALPGTIPGDPRGGLGAARVPGSWKSGLLFNSISFRLMGRRGGSCWYGAGGGGGFHRGFTPLCDIDVKFERSDSAGLRAPSGMLSYEFVAGIAGGPGGGVGLDGASNRGSMSS